MFFEKMMNTYWNKKNSKNKKGFTLIEMLVVIAVIAILVSIVIPTVGSSTIKAKAAANAANLRSVEGVVQTEWLMNPTAFKNGLAVTAVDGVLTFEGGTEYEAPAAKGITLKKASGNDEVICNDEHVMKVHINNKGVVTATYNNYDKLAFAEIAEKGENASVFKNNSQEIYDNVTGIQKDTEALVDRLSGILGVELTPEQLGQVVGLLDKVGIDIGGLDVNGMGGQLSDILASANNGSACLSEGCECPSYTPDATGVCTACSVSGHKDTTHSSALLEDINGIIKDTNGVLDNYTCEQGGTTLHNFNTYVDTTNHKCEKCTATKGHTMAAISETVDFELDLITKIQIGPYNINVGLSHRCIECGAFPENTHNHGEKLKVAAADYVTDADLHEILNKYGLTRLESTAKKAINKLNFTLDYCKHCGEKV